MHMHIFTNSADMSPSANTNIRKFALRGRLFVPYKTDYGVGHLMMQGDYLTRHFLPGTLETDSVPVSRSDLLSPARRLRTLLERYFSGRRLEFDIKDLPIDWNLYSVFEQRVARSLLETGYGELTTYSDLATAAGRPRAYRAVGNVMAKNCFPLLIPCHRVIRADGRMGGFSAGNRWKRRLLGIEGVSGNDFSPCKDFQ